MNFQNLSISTLLGKTLGRCWKVGNDEVFFETPDCEQYKLYHAQDCCESVFIEDICGDLHDLVGSPILQAEENSNSTDPPREGDDESYTWTFYRLATIKGSVVIRFFGSSNGYYSEAVDFMKL